MTTTHTVKVRTDKNERHEVFFVEAFNKEDKIMLGSFPTISRWAQGFSVDTKWGAWEISWGSSSDKTWETKCAEADCIWTAIKIFESLLDGKEVSDTGSVKL